MGSNFDPDIDIHLLLQVTDRLGEANGLAEVMY